MKLVWKFNLVLLGIFVIGFVIAGYVSHRVLQSNAREEILQHARLIMETMHAWCREEGIGSVALNASQDGRPLYETMGYTVSPNPMMFLPIVRV